MGAQQSPKAPSAMCSEHLGQELPVVPGPLTQSPPVSLRYALDLVWEAQPWPGRRSQLLQSPQKNSMAPLPVIRQLRKGRSIKWKAPVWWGK